MDTDSPGLKEEQQRDGRITIVLLISLLSIIYFGHRQIDNKDIYTHIHSYLNLTHDKLLYLEKEENSVQTPESMPLVFYPFFFFPLPINSTGQELLMTIKGVGPALASTIVTHRNKVGPITNISDLQKIPGIGLKRATSLSSELVFDEAK